MKALLPGRRFGSLTVVCKADQSPFKCTKRKNLYYLCACDCGNTREVSAYDLTGRVVTVCKTCPEPKEGRPLAHAYPLEYETWRGMRKRCNNPKAKGYKDYGGRGIKVCEEWAFFNPFMEHLLATCGPKPGPEWSIDRLDSDQDYKPGNVKWSTRHDQLRNMSRNVYLTYRGQRFVAADFAKYLGISYGVIRERYRQGWSGAKIARHYGVQRWVLKKKPLLLLVQRGTGS